jgi:lipopolysaccharide export system protein LptA
MTLSQKITLIACLTVTTIPAPAQVQVGQYRLSRYQQIVTEYKRDGTVLVRVTGNRVVLESTDGQLRIEAGAITAESRLQTGRETRLTRARAEGQVSFRLTQPKEKRTARGTAGVVLYDDATRQVTLQNGVFVEVDAPRFVATQKGDKGTIYLGEQDLRVVLEGDPSRTETVIQPKRPPAEEEKR